MPELNFVLPHWLYWGGLIILPVLAFYIHRKTLHKKSALPVSLPLGYFLLIMGGFIGVHRMYLKSAWAFVFVILFISIQVVNIEVRAARDQLSGVKNEITLAEFKLQRAEKALKDGRRGAQKKRELALSNLDSTKSKLTAIQKNYNDWNMIVISIAAVTLLLLLLDAYLLPKLVRERNLIEKDEPVEAFHCPTVEEEYDINKEPYKFNRFISNINGVTGELVAYWSIFAVFVYYYEVIARYVFNSPTNWAHESMFLMFGMQYLLAGGYVLREGAHVRVDVIYMHFSKRTKAIVDIFTSVLFFIFVLTLMVTGYIFFNDSFEVNEVSFTEWGIQYWPIKFALPLGAFLLLMQGIAQLVKDIAALKHPETVELNTEVRPEG